MINTLKISDIATKELLFFEESFKDKCYNFCKKRDIDFLPSIENPLHIYIRDDNNKSFNLSAIEKDQIIQGSQIAFQSKTLESFRQNNLLFLYSDEFLVGAIHFSDFNKPVVSKYLFDVFFRYERLLRELLKKENYSNRDMMEYFESALKLSENNNYQRKINTYNRERENNEKLPPFQSFYLDDLINLANKKGHNFNSEDIKGLRNMIMHAHELVNKYDWREDNYIFNFNKFETFFNRAILLHKDLQRVQNKLNFLNGIDELVNYE